MLKRCAVHMIRMMSVEGFKSCATTSRATGIIAGTMMPAVWLLIHGLTLLLHMNPPVQDATQINHLFSFQGRQRHPLNLTTKQLRDLHNTRMRIQLSGNAAAVGPGVTLHCPRHPHNLRLLPSESRGVALERTRTATKSLQSRLDILREVLDRIKERRERLKRHQAIAVTRYGVGVEGDQQSK